MAELKIRNPFHAASFKPVRKGKKPPKLIAVVHQSGCTGCEVCIAGCPVDSIELVPGPDPSNPEFRQMVEIDVERCIGCQNCSQDCPWETITMYGHNDAMIAWGNETIDSQVYISIDKLKQDTHQFGGDEALQQLQDKLDGIEKETAAEPEEPAKEEAPA